MRVTIGMALLAVVVGLAACDVGRGGDDRPRVAYVTNGVASFWIIARAGAMAAADDFDVRVDVRMPVEGPSDQQRIIEDLLTRGVDAIAISPIDPRNQASMIDRAARQVPLITHDSDAPMTQRLAYVGMDNYLAGRMCGELVKEAMPEGGTVMIFVGRLEQDNARGRRQGVIDELLDRPHNRENHDPPGRVIAGDKYTILDTRTDGFDFAVARNLAEDALTRHPDLGCMVGLFAYNPPLMLEAARGAGRVGQVKIVAFDEDDATLAGIEAGEIHGTIVQDPYAYAYESIRILAGLARGDESVLPEGGFLDIPAKQIRRDDVEAFRRDMQQKLARGEAE